jgi:hypothetical protein
MPCRFRTTGNESLNLSATCWASLKLLGMTRCTRTSLRPLPARTERSCASADDGHVVVGEDVVEVVAPAAAAQPADVRALAIAVLELGLGS